jgi:hypothetical protein
LPRLLVEVRQLDLGTLISQSAARIKKNWLLIVPPILIRVALPLVIMTIIVFSLLPLIVAFGLTGDTSGLVQTAVAGMLILLVGIFLFDTFVTAGWAYMNRRVVVDGRTELADLWVGARKYFLRVLGGRILVGLILAVPIIVGVVTVAASVLGLNIGQLAPPGELTPTTIVSLLAPIIIGLLGIILVVGLVELALFILLLPWMQALVMDDIGIVKSVKASFGFVRKNLATMIGYVVISGIASVVAAWIASLVWPSFSYSELTNPNIYTNGTRMLELMFRANNIVYYVISALLSAFFTLLLFVIYADRTCGPQILTSAVRLTAAPAAHVSEPPPPPSRPARGTRYCVNCGARLIIIAVFCPNCGARQPPLPPE